MESGKVIRRLAAVVIADVVGYSALMERDEGGAHARLREVRDRITDPCIAAHDGTIVKTAGDDGMLITFASATEALRCAVDGRVGTQFRLLPRRALGPDLPAGDHIAIPAFLAAAYANHGDLGKAREAKDEVLRQQPGFSIALLKSKRYSAHPTYLKLAEAYWYDGLRKAGLPEQ